MLPSNSARGGSTPSTPALGSAKIDNPASYSVAIYHFNAEIISRNNSKSAMTAAADRARNKVEDKQRGLSFDYSYKGSADYCQILAPTQARDWVDNRKVL